MLYPSKITEVDHPTSQRKLARRKLSSQTSLTPTSPTSMSEICMSSSLCTLDPTSSAPAEAEKMYFVNKAVREIQEEREERAR